MDVTIEFTESAFKHGVSREDILHAFKTKIYAAMMQEFPEKYGVIGFDRAMNPLEVMYNPIDDDHILIFHAMKLRESFKKQIGL
ncbi:MAG: hypothetical protein LBG72_08675 [Spirochaetaceae bacterium]|nr:hypothetical protein [Spirochaetaceae bacterium]